MLYLYTISGNAASSLTFKWYSVKNKSEFAERLEESRGITRGK